MFTGIIQAVGKIVSTKKSQLVVSVPFPTNGIKIGESIAVDGCCLTVVKCENKKLAFDVSAETFKKTTLGSYPSGQIVNLERAMRPSDRFGGHFVTGHVDGVGVIQKIKNGGEMEIESPKSLSRYLIDKGSITVDGISLTVCAPKKNCFTVCIVPHTQKVTNLCTKKVGSSVNLEADILGKYVQSLISRRG